jgi:hypothetical protein
VHVSFLDDRGERLLGSPAWLEEGGEIRALAQLRDRELDPANTRLPAALSIAVRMMSFVKPCDPSSTVDVRGPLASGQALGAIDSYPVGLPTQVPYARRASGRGDGIQLRVSGLVPQRLHDHASTPDVTGPSPRDDLSGWAQVAEGRSLAPAGTRPWIE